MRETERQRHTDREKVSNASANEREREKNSKKTNEPEVERERGGVGGVPGVRDRQIHHDFPPLANLTCSNIEIFMEKKTCKDKSDNSFVW